MSTLSRLSCALPITLILACGPPRETIRMSTAGHEAPPTEAEVAAHEQEEEQAAHAWLWEISGGDAASPSYLLGTMHIGVRMNVALPPPYDAHLYDARALVMEVDYRELDQYMASAPRHSVPRRQWLDRALARPTWERLVAELGDRVPADVLRQLPPAMLGLHLSQVRMAEVEAVEEGREPIRGAPSSARLDPSIFDWAIRRGTPIVALETSQEAFAAFASVEGGDALASLTAIVDEPEQAREEERRLRAAYLAFDDASLLALLNEGTTPEWREAILLGRNRAWMAHLLPEIAQGNAFVAVGVGHLLGDGSVIAALEAAGYTVRRHGAPTPAAPRP